MHAYISADPLEGRQDLPADSVLFMLGLFKAVLVCLVLMKIPLTVMFKDIIKKKRAGISSPYMR